MLSSKAAPPFRSSAVTLRFLSPGVYLLENAQYRVTLDNGVIPSLYSKLLDRELVPKGKNMNQMVLFDDKPLYWQAWDVETFHLRSRKELKSVYTQPIDQGPMRCAVQTYWKISERSWVKTTIALTGVPLAGDPKVAAKDVPAVPLEITSEIEWREDKKFLKAEFPTTLTPLHNQFISETQYGLISRPTHRNTSWDAAKFEVVNHRFSALHEARDGVAILNDSKYGFAAEGSTMRLSVIRAPKAPDGHADMGRHYCRWAILPFSNDSSAGGISKVVQAARTFNNPVSLAMENGIGKADESTPSPSTASSELEPTSNQGGRGNLGRSALFPFTELESFIYAAKPSAMPALSQLLSSFVLHQEGERNIVLDTIKRGEDDEDLHYNGSLFAPKKEKSVILRLYEAVGARAKASVKVAAGFDVKRAVRCSLLEDEEEKFDVLKREAGGTDVQVALRAFEVLTVKIVL